MGKSKSILVPPYGILSKAHAAWRVEIYVKTLLSAVYSLPYVFSRAIILITNLMTGSDFCSFCSDF